jgi:hypothetical protein
MSSVPPVVASGVAPVVSPDVVEYARKHGIEATLQQLLAVTPGLYPSARSIKVYMQQDVEDELLWFIVFEVTVRLAEVPDFLEAEKRWGAEWLRAYPYPRNHHFVLDLIRVAS